MFDQLELSLLEKFVNSFKLFEKLNVKVLRLIKHHMLVDKQDLEYMETINYFNELCIMNNVDPRMQTIVMGNLEQNFSK